MKFYGLLLIVSGILASADKPGPYTGHKLIEVPNNQLLQTFKKVEAIDIWDENPQSAVLRLTPTQYNAFKLTNILRSDDIKVLSNDVQELADRTFQQPNYKEGEDWFDNYHTYDDIKKWYIKHSKENPNHVKFVSSIGKTGESNDIFAVHLTNNNTLPNGKAKNKLWFQSLIHAREWLSGSTTQYIFNEFLNNQDTDPAISKILNENELIFIPIVNPDGYKFTNIYRFWRKNRKNLHGVDLNRNFPYNWKGEGASDNPLADDYRGLSEGSELETKSITSYFNGQGKIAGAIDFHTYSELVLRPPGDKGEAKDEAKLKELGDGIRDVIKQSRGTEYTSEKSYELYPTSGTAADWFYAEGKGYSYTIELSPKDGGLMGFAPPTDQIKPVGAELYPAVVHFINYVTSNPIN
jgi:hypothetical protein